MTRLRDGDGRTTRPRCLRWRKSDGADPEPTAHGGDEGRRSQDVVDVVADIWGQPTEMRAQDPMAQMEGRWC